MWLILCCSSSHKLWAASMHPNENHRSSVLGTGCTLSTRDYWSAGINRVVRVSTCFNFWFLHSRIVNFIQEGHVVPVPISNTEVKLDQAELVLRLETT